MTKAAGKILTLPNIISLFRAFLLIPLLIFFSRDMDLAVFLIIIVAVLSDILDGFAARRFGEITDVGKILDPMADKILILGIGIFLVFYRDLPLWFILIIVVRDLSIIILGLFIIKYRDIVPQANISGKITVVCLAITLFLYIFRLYPWNRYFLWVSLFLLVFSGLQYYIKFLKTIIKGEAASDI
ncbi:MAG: CDP-alcohol phosphatidyltransferase family protein [Fidelibacterota bacterium]